MDRFADAAAAAANPRIQDFGVLLAATARLERIFGRALERECGVSHVVFEVLLRLGGADGYQLAIRDIAENMILTSGGMTRLIDRMVAAGLVTRRQSEADRRVQLVALTDHGERTLLRAAALHVQNLERQFAGRLSDVEYAQIMVALRRLDDAARQDLGKLG